MNYYLAVDIGASSGKMLLGNVDDGRMVLQEVYRFDNQTVDIDGHLCWDTSSLFKNIITGLKRCREIGKIPLTMGIDTWAVDFVLLDENRNMLGNCVAYRDGRTKDMDNFVDEHISPQELYSKTGIQKQLFNTIYQLSAVKNQSPRQLDKAEHFLMVPDYLNFLLTGNRKNEYTNATSTNLVNAKSKTWDYELIDTLGFPKKLFGPLYMPGTVVGTFTDAVKQQVGFDCTVVLPATHDTASAFLAVPSLNENSVTISSGTWSLLGVENSRPITSESSRRRNFTNEGGYEYRYRFLKNIMGLWMIQSIRRNLDKKYSYAQLEQMARECADFKSIVDVNDSCFLAPDNMIESVKNACRKTGQPVPETIGQVMQCVYLSLARCYADTISELESITGKSYKYIHIVGGGSKDAYLNTLTARAAKLPVYAGPDEGTALGNLMAQMLKAGEYSDLASARSAIHKSFDLILIQPQH